MSDDNLRPRFAPRPTPDTRHFWEGTKVGELRLQRCADCGHIYFPPRGVCPACTSTNVGIFVASGKGKLESYMINQRQHPSFSGPYAIALVKLEEGPVMMSNIVDCAQTPEALQLDMPLQVTFEALNGDISLPLFRPTGDAS